MDKENLQSSFWENEIFSYIHPLELRLLNTLAILLEVSFLLDDGRWSSSSQLKQTCDAGERFLLFSKLHC